MSTVAISDSHATHSRGVARIIPARRAIEGDGMEIRRAIPARGIEAVGPFIFLDHFGPIEFGPGEAKGAPNHPHRGFETLTYLLEGRGEHRDSLGNVSVIGPGEAQWMRAGSGILHDEGADEIMRRDGGRINGLQFWINLPKGRKMSPPAYRHLILAEIPLINRGGVTIKMLAGTLEGVRGPVETYAEPWLAHVSLAARARTTLDLSAVIDAAVYVAAGSVRIGGENTNTQEGELALLGSGSNVDLIAAEKADVFVLGGAPLDAPIKRYGPFVMNTETELKEALRDFQEGRFGTIPARISTTSHQH